MKILVANLGSTSLKWRLFDFTNDAAAVLHQGGFERVTDYPKAIEDCLAELKDGGHIADEKDLAAVGFKTVMALGVDGCVPLDDDVLNAMELARPLAPAHTPPYVDGIRLFRKRMPNTPLIGLFETAFYQFAPEASKRYAVPKKWFEAGVKRYGFHGASHKFIAERSAELLGREDVAERSRLLYLNCGMSPVKGDDLRVISCHLGGSSSITGILNGVAIGNSMGLSPQSGLPQNNRVGDLDAFALPFMMRREGWSLEEAERQLCKESGLLGVSGVSNDIRDIAEAADRGDADAQLALDVFVHSARHWIGSYYLQLNGIDALVFTAGIGENRAGLRKAICAGLDQLGIEIDEEQNIAVQRREGEISRKGAKVKVLVIPTNEELVVAREVRRRLAASDNRA